MFRITNVFIEKGFSSTIVIYSVFCLYTCLSNTFNNFKTNYDSLPVKGFEKIVTIQSYNTCKNKSKVFCFDVCMSHWKTLTLTMKGVKELSVPFSSFPRSSGKAR